MLRARSPGRLNIVHWRLEFWGFPTKALYSFLFFPVGSTCPALFLLYLITRIIFGEECISWSSSLHEEVDWPLIIPTKPTWSSLVQQAWSGCPGTWWQKRYLLWRRYNGASVWPRTAHHLKWRGTRTNCTVLDAWNIACALAFKYCAVCWEVMKTQSWLELNYLAGCVA